MSGEDIAAARQAMATRCAAVARLAALGKEWFAANPGRTVDQSVALERDMRRMRARAEKLQAAAIRPMCVTAFGASQAGKSYLISALARPASGILDVQIGGTRHDFLQQINPPGGEESTGLVTRFSVAASRVTTAALPIAVRLFSQSDIVRVVANGYLEEINRDFAQPMQAAAVDAMLRALPPAGSPRPGMSEDDVFEMQEYFGRYFRAHPVVTALGSDYWRVIGQKAPGLDGRQRATLFAPLWGGNESLTSLAARLLGALDALGNPDETCCEEAALIPRADSIVAVQTLMKGLEDDGAAQVRIGRVDGTAILLPRPLVAALVAELRLTLAEPPAAFGAELEVLDFPGAMARGENSQVNDVRMIFRRGKIAYLFQRYVADQELAAMVLCVDYGNQAVKTLPHTVKQWIDATHGATPKERDEVACSLFVGLTKFDLEFSHGNGTSDDEPGYWVRRLRTVFTEYLCEEHKWNEEWTPGRPFSNVLWLRNPRYQAHHLMDYDAAGREVALRDPRRIARLRDTFVATSEVQRHFADPGQAYDEGLRLNDGGTAYLARMLAPVCRPQMKLDQIAGQLAALKQEIERQLDPFHLSDDTVKEQQKRVEEVRLAVQRIQTLKDSKHFGHLLAAMQLPQGSLLRPFLRVQEETMPKMRNDNYELPRSFATTALEEWNATVRAMGTRGDLSTAVGIDRQTAEVLARTLALIANAAQLRERLETRIRPHFNAMKSTAERPKNPALVAELVINDFVAGLGMSGMAVGQRPRRSADGVDGPPVFQSGPTSDDVDGYLDDWTAALSSGSEGAVDGPKLSPAERQANMKLGIIIAELARA